MLNFRRPLITVLLVSVLVAACASPEERAAEFVADARQYYAAGDLKADLLQAQHAAQTNHKSAGTRFLTADIHKTHSHP